VSSRRFEFTPTAAVEASRRRRHYIHCPACDASSERYLFHRSGSRFVQCRSCGLVYVDPIDPTEVVDFAFEPLEGVDLDNVRADFGAVLREVVRSHEHHTGRVPRSIVVFGQWDPTFAEADAGEGVDLVFGGSTTAPDVETVGDRLATADVVLLHRLVEGVAEPSPLLTDLRDRMGSHALLAVTFANMAALPNRVFRRRLRTLFDHQRFLYDADNLGILMWRNGFQRAANVRLRSRVSLGYTAARTGTSESLGKVLDAAGLDALTVTASTGIEMILFTPVADRDREQLSVIVPVFNEARYVADVLDALIEAELPIDREIVIVESNSTDGSREIVQRYEDMPGVTVIYEDSPKGKGRAVRRGLEAATGSIVLIQDADFEYDLDDYEALLEPIVRHRASFVLGSRSLGLDDWKVRQYASSPVKGFLMNFAQVVFAKTFNLLYQQNVSDINTMFKVFRRECVAGCHFEGDGFNFDIELVCKIVRNGYSPMEVPVNYVSRGFDEGKKINFLFDAYPSYFMLFKARLGQI
jgi:hypothetical protein